MIGSCRTKVIVQKNYLKLTNSPNRDSQSSNSLNERELRDATSLLYKNATGGVFVIIIASFALIFVFSDNLSAYIKWFWFSAMTIVQTARALDILRWHKKIAKTEFNGSKYYQRFSYGAITSGLIWAIYPIIAFKHLSMIELTSTIVILAGLTGGASTLLAASKKLTFFYISCLLLPMSVCCLFWSDNINTIYLGLLGLTYWIIVLEVSNKNSKFIHHAIHIHNENDELLDGMATEKANLQVIHKKLNHAYQELNHANETLEQKVSERTQALKQLAARDSLTGLLN